MLEDIAKSNKNLSILFVTENKRKIYQENILRFFALKNFMEYSSSIKKTLNTCMSKNQNADEQAIEEFKKKFNSTIDIIKQVLGDDAFCAYDREKNTIMKKFSGSVYDSIIIPFAMFNNHDIMVHADEIRKAINDIKSGDAEYQEYTYAATGSKNRVIGRITKIYLKLREIIGKDADTGIRRIYSSKTKEELFYPGYICSYCGNTILSIDDAEVDHMKPFSLGGETTIENAQLLHRHCNREKNNNLQEENMEFEDDESVE